MACSGCASVSPLLICPLSEAHASAQAGHSVDDNDGPIDLKRAAVLGEPTVGIEAVTWDHRGQGGIAARPLPSPKELTQAAIDRHNLTHWPYESWCPIRAASRRPICYHRLQQDSSRQIPLLVGDYAFIMNSGDDELMCVSTRLAFCLLATSPRREPKSPS